MRIVEGNSGSKAGTVTVTLAKASSSEVRVAWSLVGGTAGAGTDFPGGSGVLVFAAGETSRTVAFTILGDAGVEADETFSVALGAVTGATVGQGTGVVTIANDDPPSRPSASAASG